MKTVWVVRLGEKGKLADKCKEKGVIAVGWKDVGDLSAFKDFIALRRSVYMSGKERYRGEGSAGVATGMLWSFLKTMKEGDIVLSPKSESREVLIGTISGPYRYDKSVIDEKHPNIRAVEWIKTIPYDEMPREVWRSITAWQTLFELALPDAVAATENLVKGGSPKKAVDETVTVSEHKEYSAMEEGQMLFEETNAKSLEILATYFDTFTGMEFQEIVWAVLKAAGLYPKQIRQGRDRGIDIEAYHDLLQLGPTRVIVQVKHREGQTSGPEARAFLGTMKRGGDVGLFVSTGGFSKDAILEAQQSHTPVSLMGWEDFIKLFLLVYDKLDNEFKARVPLGSVNVLLNPQEPEEEPG